MSLSPLTFPGVPMASAPASPVPLPIPQRLRMSADNGAHEYLGIMRELDTGGRSRTLSQRSLNQRVEGSNPPRLNAEKCRGSRYGAFGVEGGGIERMTVWWARASRSSALACPDTGFGRLLMSIRPGGFRGNDGDRSAQRHDGPAPGRSRPVRSLL